MFYTFCSIFEKLIRENRNIAICPLGKMGVEAKYILNTRYGYQEKYIIDNNIADFNPNVIKVDELPSCDLEKLVILMTTENDLVCKQLVKEIELLNLKNVEIVKCKKDIEYITVKNEEDILYLKYIKKLLKAKKVLDCDLIRIGKDYDGGYILANDFIGSSIVYSFGISNDVSFDWSMAMKNMQIFQYDHTIDELPKVHENFHFFKIGISGIDCPNENVMTLETLIKMNGHQEQKNMILKMDVEGAEWDAFKYMSSECIKQFKQISLEIHDGFRYGIREKVINVLKKINQSHQVVSIHANNNAPVYKGKEVEVPALIEVTFLNKESFSFADEPCYFPLDIHMPNVPRKNEIYMGNWGKEK